MGPVGRSWGTLHGKKWESRGALKGQEAIRQVRGDFESTFCEGHHVPRRGLAWQIPGKGDGSQGESLLPKPRTLCSHTQGWP